MPPAAPSAGDLAALSIFPLPNAALFPGALLPLHVFEPRYRDLVREALAGSKVLAVARLKPGFEPDYAGRPPVFEVCGAGRIVEHTQREDGRYDILLRGVSRVRILAELPPATSFRVVRAELIDDLPAEPRLAASLEAKLQSLWRSLAPRLPEALRNLEEIVHEAASAGAYSDAVAALIIDDSELSQVLLAEPDPCERLQLIAERLQTLTDALVPPVRGGSSRMN